MYKKMIIEWFGKLETREQLLLKIGSIILVIGLFYGLVWAPMNNTITRQTALLEQQQALSTWIVQQGPGKATLKGSIVQAVNQTAKASNITLTRIQPSNDEVQVWIDEVEFNTLMVWLDSLDKSGVQVLQADMSESGGAGMVKVRRLQLGKS